MVQSNKKIMTGLETIDAVVTSLEPLTVKTLLDFAKEPQRNDFSDMEGLTLDEEFKLFSDAHKIWEQSRKEYRVVEGKQRVFVAVDVNERLPDFATIHFILVGGRIPMMAQYRPKVNESLDWSNKKAIENQVLEGEWWTLGMSQATRIEEHKKCVTHWLEEQSHQQTHTFSESDMIGFAEWIVKENYIHAGDYENPNEVCGWYLGVVTEDCLSSAELFDLYIKSKKPKIGERVSIKPISETEAVIVK